MSKLNVLPGRIKVRWSQKNPRRNRNVIVFVILMFLTPFCLLCILLRPDAISVDWSQEDNDRNGTNNNPLSSESERRLPKCIIIGARKCGTRALLEFLSIHSQVITAHDEVHFFDEDSNYNLGLDWYRQQMPYSTLDQITIEKTPSYFVTESAPNRIRRMDEGIKLILIVRDPVTRLISDYAQLNANKIAKGERPLKPFERMIFTEDGEVDINYKPVKTSIYALYYEWWTQIFPSSQILVVDGDRLIYDPVSEVERVEDFLGISHEVTAEHFSFNATKGFYCIRMPGSDVEKCLNETKGRRHPKISSHHVSLLRKFYATYNRRLYLISGHNFGWPEE